MPLATIPLVVDMSRRGYAPTESPDSSKDARLVSVLPRAVDMGATNSRSWYAEKRQGWAGSAHNSGAGHFIYSNTFKGTFGTLANLYQQGSDIFFGTTNCGTLDGTTPRIMQCDETVINGVFYYIFTVKHTSTSTSAYFLPSDAALDATPTFTADTTSGSAVLANVSSTTNVHVGQKLSGTGIAATARVQSIDSATQITMTANATANGSGITITFERMAKIIDADFPTTFRGGVVNVDGRNYVMSLDGQIYGSNQNSIVAWTADNYIPADWKPDQGVGVARVGNILMALGATSVQYFNNAGNPAGSALQRINVFKDIGVVCNSTPDIKNYCVFKGVLYAICSGRQGHGIYAFGSDGFQKISSAEVDRYLLASGCSIQAFSYAGNDYIHLVDYSGNFKYDILYSVELKRWFESGFPYPLHISQWSGTTRAVSPSVNSTLLSWTSGSDYQDNGSAFTMTIQTEPHVLNKGRAFHINSIELIADNQASGNTGIAVSGDDYATFSTARNFDMTQTRKKLWRFGRFRNHAIFKLTHSDNTAWRGQVLLVDWEPATT